MAGFKFRLQSVLRLREHQRQRRRTELAAGLDRLRTIQGYKLQMKSELEQLERDMRSQTSRSSVDVDRLLDGNRYQVTLKVRLAEIAKAMGEASDEVERCRKSLVEADRQVKVLEKLHEKQLDEHRQRLAADEVKQLDESALIGKLREA